MLNDAFWAPKLRQWSTVTARDVLDKFEGRHMKSGERRNTLDNFRNVAKGDRNTNNHVNLPWFDGLIYESIRGIADLMAMYPDEALKLRIDSVVNIIAAAQATEPSGYINTYTQLNENDHRWGENGGLLRWMHDVISLSLPMQPRFVGAHPSVEQLAGQVAIACGPLVYCLESIDNEGLETMCLDTSRPLQRAENMASLDNAPAVTGMAVNADGKRVSFRAIPYYLLGNRKKGTPYKVWLPAQKSSLGECVAQ